MSDVKSQKLLKSGKLEYVMYMYTRVLAPHFWLPTALNVVSANLKKV